MTACQLIQRLHQHRMWATQRVLVVCGRLSWEELLMPFSIGQGSVWKSLTHLMAAEYVWLETLLGDESALFPGDLPNRLPGNQAGPDPMASYEELIARWQALDLRWTSYLSQLTEPVLDETVYRISTSSGQGKRFGTRRADVLLHLCTHAQYTTAQVVNMLRQLGQESLPEVMLISLAREEVAGR